MKKVKVVCLIILIFLVIYGVYLGVELKRFSSKLGCRPLITIGNIETYVEAGSKKTKEKITGLGFTVEYEIKTTKKSDDLVMIDVLAGQFKLFDKVILMTYVVQITNGFIKQELEIEIVYFFLYILLNIQ